MLEAKLKHELRSASSPPGTAGFPRGRSDEAVLAVLHERPLDLFQQATTSAAGRADSVSTSLRVGLKGVEVGVRVNVHVHAVRDDEGVAGLSPVT
jgi:hypothetical protein